MIALQALASGVTLGALYGLFALTVVVLYRTTSTVNFAQANMASLMAFVTLFVLIPLGLPLWLAYLLAVLLGAALGAVVYFVVLRPRPSKDHYNELFRTLGLSLLIFSVVQLLWGPGEPYNFPSIVTGSFSIFGYHIQWLQLLTLVVSLLLAGAFALFLRTPRIGLMMRAVASDKDVARILGVRVRLVELTAWIIVGAIGAAIGLLFAPLYALTTDTMEPFLLKGFAAALLGGLMSFRGAIVGGLLIGIVDAQVAVFLGNEWRDVASFLVLVTVLLLRPHGIFGRARVVRV